MRRLLTALFALFLVGCSRPPEFSVSHFETETDDLPMDGLLRQEILQKVKILSDRPTGPHGVLFKFKKREGTQSCSTTYIGSNRFITAGHCVAQFAKLGKDSFSILANELAHDGTERPVTISVSGVEWTGDVQSNDIAILKVPPGAADGIEPMPMGSVPEAKRDLSNGSLVTVWGFAPISKFPQIEARFPSEGKYTMWFQPKTCLASQNIPRFSAMGRGALPVISRPPQNLNSVSHVVLDTCVLFHGYSGAAMTTAAHPRQMIGPYHWGVVPKEETLRSYSIFQYFGNRRTWETWTVNQKENLFYGVGSLFEPPSRVATF